MATGGNYFTPWPDRQTELGRERGQTKNHQNWPISCRPRPNSVLPSLITYHSTQGINGVNVPLVPVCSASFWDEWVDYYKWSNKLFIRVTVLGMAGIVCLREYIHRTRWWTDHRRWIRELMNIESNFNLFRTVNGQSVRQVMMRRIMCIKWRRFQTFTAHGLA